MAALWPPSAVISVYLAVGRLGFYPTDEGLVEAWTYRILHGEVPHRDFVSPLPLGSALLHIVDFLIPGPLFEVARVIALCEYVAYAVLFAWLRYAVAPHRWGVAMAAGAAGSMLINLNVFPIMSWYTVDGLLCIAAGFVLIQQGEARGSHLMTSIGFVVVGLAALTKQSFVPAPAFAWLLLWDRLRPLPWSSRIATLLRTGVLAAAPSLIFIGVISALGGFHDMTTQLLGTGFVYGRPLASAWSPAHDLKTLATAVAAAGLLTAFQRRTGWLGLGCRIALTALIAAVPFITQLGAHGSDWAIHLFWMTAAVWVVNTAATRTVDAVGPMLLGCAWMSSLSYGYAVPDLVAGSLVLYMLHRAWSGYAFSTRRALNTAPAVAAVLLLATTAWLFDMARQHDVYRDRPASQLTASLSAVSPAFGDIRTNPQTAEYLTEMAQCVRRYPARYVAILPENAAIYPALSLNNPFPIDWIWWDSVHGSEARILATTDLLNREGDYLVMFQTIGEPAVVNGPSLPPAKLSSNVLPSTDLPAEIYARLHGTRATCGTFLVVYSPPLP